MLVIKQTTHLLWTCRCNLSVRQSALLLTVFTHPGYRPRLIIPVSALICGMFYMHRRVAFPIHMSYKTKTPGGLVLGSFLDYAVYFYTTVLRDPKLISGVRLSFCSIVDQYDPVPQASLAIELNLCDSTLNI